MNSLAATVAMALLLTGSGPSDAGQNHSLPVITGVTLSSYFPLLADPVTASADGVFCDTKTYQWKRDGSDISGETATSYTVVSADMGTMLTCEVTGHNAYGDSAPVTSDPASPIG